MSAIAALLVKDPRRQAERLRAMLAAAPHRGQQIDFLTLGQCSLGICSLPDWEESALAAKDGLAVAFAGRFDDLGELARDLGIDESNGKPGSADIMLDAFRRLGTALPNRLRGTYAVAITDGQHLWCFRDHLGLRTLFYREDTAGLYVASEAKQVVAGSGVPRKPDLEVVTRIFYGSYDDNTPSSLKGVRRLPKATILEADARGMRMSRYWQPETLLESAKLSEADLSATFERLMTQAVARSLAGRPVISLSGGIDSPTLAAFAAPEHMRATGRPLAALATVYPHLPSVDESGYVRMIAEFLGLQLFTCERTARPFVSLRDWAALLDGPIPRLWLADAEEHYRVARQLGFTTMLTGEVAEFVVDIRSYIIPHLLWRGRFKALWRNLEASRARGTSLRRLGWDLASTFLPGFADATYVRFWGMRHRPRIPDWLSARMVNAGRAQSLVPVRHRWRDFQLSGFSGPGLSVEANEVCQMVCGIRVRMPWSDVDLWEFFLSLPAEIKHPYPRRKALIRQLLRGRLPDAILDRRDKSGFEASMIERFDYDAIHRWVINQPYRMPGVDYRRLAEHLEGRDFDIVDIRWASDLANVHAFLSLW